MTVYQYVNNDVVLATDRNPSARASASDLYSGTVFVPSRVTVPWCVDPAIGPSGSGIPVYQKLINQKAALISPYCSTYVAACHQNFKQHDC